MRDNQAYVKFLKKIRHIPPFSWPIDIIKTPRKLRDQANMIRERDQTIQQLADRNDEWAREVRALRHEGEAMHIIWPVTKEDLIKAGQPRKESHTATTIRTAESRIIVWVIPPMGPVSGGHTTILRIVAGLEARGHTCLLYIYDPSNISSAAEIQENLVHYPEVKAKIKYNFDTIESCDAIFATSWHTAYPVYNAHVAAKKYYLVQDFEPLFEPAGSYSTLADNTYKFGFHGITLGGWMKDKLESEYGMTCDNFDLAVTGSEYTHTNRQERHKIVFYARPVTPRRGFELGVLALEVFHEQHPEYEIHLVGWDVSRYDIPFPYINHGTVPIADLNVLYNTCAAGLVLSFTNMSLLPLEMMAGGCVPVVNRAPCTTSVGYSQHVTYVQPTALEIANGLYKAAQKSKDETFVTQMVKSTKAFSWDALHDSIDSIIRKP